MQSMRTLLALVTLVFACTFAHGQGIAFDKVRIITQQLAPNVYSLQGSAGVDPGHPEGAGGRIGMLAGPDEPMQLPSTLAHTMKWRAGSTGSPSPTSRVHQPGLPVSGWVEATY